MSGGDISSVSEQLEKLFYEQGPMVYRYLMGALGRQDDAEDVFQQIWLSMSRQTDR